MLWWGEPRISDSNSIVCFITQEMHEFSNEYAKKGKIQQNASYEESRKIGTHIFSKVWVLPWYPMVQFIPREMHGYSYENLIAREHAAKPILWGELAIIDSHTFPKVWVVLSHQISILWYTLSHGNGMSFTINVPLHEEAQNNPSFKSVCSINFSFYGTLH